MVEDIGHGARYSLRKRRRIDEEKSPLTALECLLNRVSPTSQILVFSGSGLSASSGMSTFSTKGGLYEKAQRRFGLADGKTLFTYSFYEKNRKEAQDFLSEVYLEALQATPGKGHHAIAGLLDSGQLIRHYTLNIDGLAEKAGMSTWHPDNEPNGITVELHGNVHHLVCTECGTTTAFTRRAALEFQKTQRHIPCTSCSENEPLTLRPKVMLYEDEDSEFITPDDVLDLMEKDAKSADVILWVGISFQQSASTSYFRRIRRALQEAGRSDTVVQALINPSEETLWNLLTACSNQHELNVLDIKLSADIALPQIANHVQSLKVSNELRTAGTSSMKPRLETRQETEEIFVGLSVNVESDAATIRNMLQEALSESLDSEISPSMSSQKSSEGTAATGGIPSAFM